MDLCSFKHNSISGVRNVNTGKEIWEVFYKGVQNCFFVYPRRLLVNFNNASISFFSAN